MKALDAERPISTRVGIARLAAQVVAADPGVGPTAGGGRWVTRDGDRVIPGVVVAAARAGRVDVALHLVAFLPPRPLGEQAAGLRVALVATAAGAGVAERLGQVDITIHDLRERTSDAVAS